MQAVRAPLALSLAACALALGSCSSNGSPAPEQGHFSGDARAVQALKCSDWKGADPATREHMLSALRTVIGGQISGRGANGRGSVLSHDRAYSLFDRYCRNDFARHFSLYKLYGQASGFAGGRP